MLRSKDNFMENLKKKILKSKRIILRPMRLTDAKHYPEWFVDKQVVRFLASNLYKMKEEKVKEYIKSVRKDKEHFLWTIISEDNKNIGNTSLKLFPEHKRASFGIVIGDKDYWGRGYAPEIIKILENMVFGKLKYNKFELVVYANNKSAQRTYDKVGFKREGILKLHSWNWVDKKFCDEIMMGITRKEWLARHKMSGR